MACEPDISIIDVLVPHLVSLHHRMGIENQPWHVNSQMMDIYHSKDKYFLCRSCVVFWGATWPMGLGGNYTNLGPRI